MRQPEWLLSWWEEYSPRDAELYLLAAYEAGALVGLAPCYRLRADRQIRFLGDGEVCTDYNGILVSAAQESNTIEAALADWLLSQSLDQDLGWSTLYWEGIPKSDAVTRRVYSHLALHGCTTLERNAMNTWCIDLEDGWDGYLARSSKDTRKRLRRRAASLADLQIRRVESEQDWDRFYPILIDLHQKRRKSLGEPGCFVDMHFTSFLQSASLRLLPLGQLQAVCLERDGRPLAADIGFRSRSQWFVYQGGIEPSALELEPGKMLNVWTLANAPSQGITAIDFLRGDEPYKKQLKADPHPIEDLWVARPGWKGATQKWLWQSKQLIAKTAKSVYQTHPVKKT